MQTKKGFTIIELLLAMTMVSMLMLAIAMMVMQMMTLMTKGNTFRELNAAGRTINDDFTRSFNSLNNIDNLEYGGIAMPNETGYTFSSISSGGAFCSGKFSYVWNAGNGDDIKYSNGSIVKLARIEDPTKRYCSFEGDNVNHLERIPVDEAKELIGNGEVDLRIQDIDFRLLGEDQNSGQQIILITYVIKTNTGDNILSPTCSPTHQMRDYCAINKFELVVRTLGR